MNSDAASVDDYLAGLPRDRREALEAVRAVILDRLGPGFVEAMSWGMISYEVPLEVSGPTYNGKPLVYAALASQKHHMAIYLNSVYGDDATLQRFTTDYLATGKKLDMGKSCVRFRRLDDLPLEVVGDAVAAFDAEEFVAQVHGGQHHRG